jgi:hypothetical protein
MSGLLALHWVFPIIYLFTCFAFLGTIFVLSPIFSCCLEEKFLRIFDGDDRKSTSGICFYILVIPNLALRPGLLLPYMLGLDSLSFLHKHVFVVFLSFFFSIKKKKKKLGEKMQNFFFDSFSDIACLFASYLNLLCIA